jgi:16S rRNA (guanine527-N7)-methyltransferase
MEELLLAAGVEPQLAAALARYATMVLATNREFNLTGAKSEAELFVHVIDSLSVVPFVGASLVDVGSGAGLPAIPVALATGIPVTLIETTRKKAHFLERAIAELGIDGTVVVQRAEVAAHDETLRERFASGTARAVSAAPTVAELLLPLIATGGVAILQRGAMEPRERSALADASLMLGGEVEDERTLEGDRRIVLVRKRAPTPIRFPRRTGVPEKRPLCY